MIYSIKAPSWIFSGSFLKVLASILAWKEKKYGKEGGETDRGLNKNK